MDKLSTIRSQFPITRQEFIAPDGERRRIIYLDHGASTHPPAPVLDFYREFLERYYANIHRGNHFLSQKASDLFDGVSERVLGFLGAEPSRNSVVFTLNTTTAIDIASYLMGECEGITLVSGMEHHSNDLPHRRRGETRRIEVLDDGSLDYDDLERKLKANRVKLVAVTGASNVTGYLPDVHLIARLAHQHGARILVDGAQILAHKKLDMRPNDADDHIDFFAAAGHKAYAPFGAAFLVTPSEVCNETTPYIPGGGTVKFVTNEDAVWAEGQERHSGGTPNIPGVVALGRALEWLEEIGMDWVREHELELLRRAESGMRRIEGLRFLSTIPPERRLGVMTFTVDGIYHEDVSIALNDHYGIATRNGCFCAHPYLTHLLRCSDPTGVRDRVVADPEAHIPGAVRATIGIFNNEEDVDALISALEEVAADPARAQSIAAQHAHQCGDPA